MLVTVLAWSRVAPPLPCRRSVRARGGRVGRLRPRSVAPSARARACQFFPERPLQRVSARRAALGAAWSGGVRTYGRVTNANKSRAKLERVMSHRLEMHYWRPFLPARSAIRGEVALHVRRLYSWTGERACPTYAVAGDPSLSTEHLSLWSRTWQHD